MIDFMAHQEPLGRSDPPMLLVLNGPPAVGKSTLARRYRGDHPLCLVLDLDLLRAELGGWQDDVVRAGLRARALALAMAADQLAAGHDVVVPQLVARPPFLDQLETVAAQAGARFVEVVLNGDRAGLMARFAERQASEPVAVRRDLSVAELAALVDRVESYAAQRPRAVTVPVVDGDVAATYRRLLRAVEGATARS
jgi:predicted kinase